MAINPQRLIDAVVAAQRLVAELPEDEQLRCDTIEGETQLFELVDRYAEQAISDKNMAEAAVHRAQTFRKRAERQRQVVLQILDAVGLTQPLRRPLYTASVTHHSRTIITNEAQLPPAFLRAAPDLHAIDRALRAGETVPGAELTNPEPNLLLKVR